MLGQVSKLAAEVVGVVRVGGYALGARYALAVARALPQVLRDRTLQGADRAMRGSASVRFGSAHIQVPFSAVDAANPVVGDACTFSGLRELYVGQVYLRGFRSLDRVQTCVDLGANRGMVSVLAAIGLGAETVLGVEAQAAYDAPFQVLADANDLTARQRLRAVTKIAGSDTGEGRSVAGLCAEHGIGRIDFLKCDVEGWENEVVLEGGAFLKDTELIAMELHPDRGTRSDEIVAALTAAGLTVAVSANDGGPAPIAKAGYLYAAKDPAKLSMPIVANP